MNVHKQKFYLLKQHCESFEIWLASIMINTEGNILDNDIGPRALTLSL